ncbi:twin-arginine translocation signal domain-containing protein, partial [Cronobacter sakazakii]
MNRRRFIKASLALAAA